MMQQPGLTGAPAQSQSLYRKYRPRSFAPDELVGQEHIARTLRNAIALDRVAHAYLFCGPRGTGKTSTARLLAKAVNCLHPDPLQRPCNECAACQAINSGAATDIIEIDAASNRGVDDIRDLREKVKYAPTQLRVKFYIIDEAHQLTRDAFNAFLKTLEEPPPHVKFVLATTEADKLPETVASRCQRFDFRRISLENVVDRLRAVCVLEGLEAEDEALRMIARQSTGSLRDALGLLDQLTLAGEPGAGTPVVTADAVRRILGLSRNDRLVSLVEALAARDAGTGLRLIAEAAESGEDVYQLNRQLVAYLRSLLHLRAGGRDIDADDTARSQAARFSLAELVELVRGFSAIDGAMNKGSYAQLPLEIAFVQAVLGPAESPARPAWSETPTARGAATAAPAAAPAPSLADPVRAVPPVSRSTADAASAPTRQAPAAAPSDQAVAGARRDAPADAPSPARPPATRETPAINGAARPLDASLERLVASWSQIRRDVKTANSRIAALLGSVDPAAIRGDEIILVSPYEFHRNKLNEDVVRRVLEDVIARYLGGAVRAICLAPEDPQVAAARSAPAPAVAPERPAEVATAVEEPPPPEPPAPAEPAAATDGTEGDPAEERLRAAKSIFAATEIEA